MFIQSELKKYFRRPSREAVLVSFFANFKQDLSYRVSKNPPMKIILVNCVRFFKKLGFTPCKAEQPLQGVTRKRSIKRLKHKGHLFRRNLQLIGVC